MNETRTALVGVREMTDEAVVRQRAAYEAAKAHIERMRARHGGVPLAESWPIIRAARQERGDES